MGLGIQISEEQFAALVEAMRIFSHNLRRVEKFDRKYVRSREEIQIEELEARNAILHEKLAQMKVESSTSRAIVALVKSGIPLQATRDPETTPPLRISVSLARAIMEEAEAE